ncbi:MAG TPA: hypothetical protein VEU47_19645 [Candidatus Cybelea sp.]|nr:hypothetical protein [Candidatus Cybelea sp.]
MSQAENNIVPLDRGERSDPYLDAREAVVDFLIRHSLIESHASFQAHGRPYPFVLKNSVVPGGAVPAAEHTLLHTALIFLIDGELPRILNKHFRLRQSNRVTWGNLQRLAPHIDFTDYKAAHCRLDAPEVEHLLAKLCTLDYALMITRPPTPRGEPQGPCALTHMHVKVERMTDSAIKELGKSLGYIERRLFERGEDYVDALEAKFFEYHGFSYNASGRKGAAAMAAQLLASTRMRFSVFVVSQEDGRLTVLDDSPLVTQYMLIRLELPDLERFDRLTASHGGLKAFSAIAGGRSSTVLYRVRFRRSAAAQADGGARGDRSLAATWLEIADEAILSPSGTSRLVVPFDWAQVRA